MNVSNFIKSGDYGYSLDYKWTEGLSLFKPIWYWEREDMTLMSYKDAWRDYKGYPKMNRHFQSNDLSLRIHHCKDAKYVVGGGTLFLKEGNQSPTSINSFKPLIITCLNEDGTLTMIVNTEIKTIKTLKSFIKKNVETFTGEIIWTNRLESYCFNELPKVRFKNFIDQRNYYQHVADEWVKANTKVGVLELVEEDLGF